MLISKKKNNPTTKILAVLLGFLCGLTLVSCQLKSSADSEIVGSPPVFKSDVELSEAEHTQLETLNGKRAEAQTDADLFRQTEQAWEKVGEIAAGQWVQLVKQDFIDSPYLPVADSDYFIDGRQFESSGWTRKLENHLIPFQETITAKANHTLSTAEGQTVMTIFESRDYPVMVKEPTRTGILLDERILYIAEDAIADRFEADNTSQTAAESIPVLMYHFFYSEQAGEKRKDGNWVEVNELKEQLDALKSEQWVSLTMSELELVLNEKARAPQRSFVITIDDGDPSVAKYAYPIIRDSGYNATLFLICGWAGETLSFEMIQMREDGLELQSHSFLMHQSGCPGMGHGGRLLCVDTETGIADTIQSLEYVDSGFVYCYPFGDVNDHAVEILKQSNVRLAFTTEYGKVHAGQDRYRLPRIRVTGGAGLEQFMRSLD